MQKAFTLVEVLVVMGIIVILMAVGIASARYSIKKANRIIHENAAESLYEALQSYYTENNEFPPSSYDSQSYHFERMTSPNGVLTPYIDNQIDFGSEAMYYYVVSQDQQTVLVCVSLWGLGDVNLPDDAQLYCTGNGIGSPDLSTNITSNYVEYGSDGYYDLNDIAIACSWYGDSWD